MHNRMIDSNSVNSASPFIPDAGFLSLSARHSCALFLAIAAVLLLPSDAFAADPLTATICTIVQWLTGRMGAGIATLGVIVIGIGALLGKVSWGLAITIAAGISIMFGGAKIVYLLTNQAQAQTICAGTADPGMMGDVLCNLAGLASKPTGRALATIGVAILGIGALLGKVSYGMALVVACGIATIFGAQDIASRLAGGFNTCSPGGV